jgi:hypothetical protein
MKRQWQWRICRQVQHSPDAQRRWDQAYQHLLRWSQSVSVGGDPTAPSGAPPVQEVRHECGDLRAGLHPAPSPGADH